MPGLALVHHKNILCSTCGELVVAAESYSDIVTRAGELILFNDDPPPRGLNMYIECGNGHRAPMSQSSELVWAANVFDRLPEAKKAVAVSFIDGTGSEKPL